MQNEVENNFAKKYSAKVWQYLIMTELSVQTLESLQI